MSEKSITEYGPATCVQIEFSDGTLRRLNGEAADRFLKHVVNADVRLSNHGAQAATFPWETIDAAKCRNCGSPMVCTRRAKTWTCTGCYKDRK